MCFRLEILPSFLTIFKIRLLIRKFFFQNLLESVSTNDCRSYLLIFHSDKILNEFSLENPKSGEIILMKNIKDLSVEEEVKCYSLTRCQLNMEEGVIRNYFLKLFDTRFESLPLIRIH